ncbi:hypothetical protein NEA10_05680 [Phormidium yuhuli AB48]|uniref:VWA containing CoxE family protein n=1 Tax=Phormidium yuhuli AB48 TaxID=2940671 RepID=A0ABY5AVH1_9CYAN|nr:hypothetical protein [Phormidium yuhuli]USR92214.1 hypothetical protein NEA10_05680 [Phormidium yuhuli AB48]
MFTLPLYNLFQKLRQPLGLRVDDYELVLKGLEHGFGCESLEDLKFLCSLIWLKSHEPTQLEQFNAIFADYQEDTPESRQGDAAYKGEVELTDASISRSSANSSFLGVSNVSSVVLKPVVQADTPPSWRIDSKPDSKPYIVEPRDFPFQFDLTRRCWRRLRQTTRIPVQSNTQRRSVEVDIPKAIAAIERDGILWSIPWQPQRVNLTELALFIDFNGSMIPFHRACDLLVQTIEPEYFAHVEPYYYQNVPYGYLRSQGRAGPARDLDQVLQSLSRQWTVAVVISDTGAAQATYESSRVERTQAFLNQLTDRVRWLFWLNPVPEDRWQDTTAEDVQDYLQAIGGNMFPLSQDGIDSAIATLYH